MPSPASCMQGLALSPGSRDEAVENVRSRADILEWVGRYVKLKKTGRSYVGLCPFHAEKTPSFNVRPDKGLFRCFGCGASGDVFSFLMKMEGKTFPEALSELATRYGVELPRRRPVDAQAQQQRSRMLGLNESAASLYERNLWDQQKGGAGLAYWRARGLSDELAREFRVGYALPDWHHLSGKVIDQAPKLEDALSLGLLARGKRGPFDVFRHRLVFPILGLDNKVRGFGARALGDEDGPKYLNSRQSPIYDKSEVLYGLAQARAQAQRAGQLLLVEGYFDVLSLVAAGFPTSVATCGTALTDGHAAVLRRFTSKVITIFDGDAAGRKASLRAARVLLAGDLAPYMVSLPAGQDPDSLVREQGAAAMAKLIEGARPSVEVLAEMALANAGEDVEARHAALAELLPLLSACRDRLRQAGYLRFLSERFGLDENELRRALGKQQQGPGPVARSEPAPTPSRAQPTAPTVVHHEEETLAVLLMRFPALAARFAESQVLSVFSAGPLGGLVAKLLQPAPPAAAALLAELDDEQLRGRLTGRVMDEEILAEAESAAELDQWAFRLRRRRIKEELRKLTERIGQSERSGEADQTQQLLESKMRLDKELLALSVVGRTGP